MTKEEGEKYTCPICKKEVDYLEPALDQYGIPIMMTCGSLSCVRKAKSTIRKDYRDYGY